MKFKKGSNNFSKHKCILNTSFKSLLSKKLFLNRKKFFFKFLLKSSMSSLNLSLLTLKEFSNFMTVKGSSVSLLNYIYFFDFFSLLGYSRSLVFRFFRFQFLAYFIRSLVKTNIFYNVNYFKFLKYAVFFFNKFWLLKLKHCDGLSSVCSNSFLFSHFFSFLIFFRYFRTKFLARIFKKLNIIHVSSFGKLEFFANRFLNLNLVAQDASSLNFLVSNFIRSRLNSKQKKLGNIFSRICFSTPGKSYVRRLLIRLKLKPKIRIRSLHKFFYTVFVKRSYTKFRNIFLQRLKISKLRFRAQRNFRRFLSRLKLKFLKFRVRSKGFSNVRNLKRNSISSFSKQTKFNKKLKTLINNSKKIIRGFPLVKSYRNFYNKFSNKKKSISKFINKRKEGGFGKILLKRKNKFIRRVKYKKYLKRFNSLRSFNLRKNEKKEFMKEIKFKRKFPRDNIKLKKSIIIKRLRRRRLIRRQRLINRIRRIKISSNSRFKFNLFFKRGNHFLHRLFKMFIPAIKLGGYFSVFRNYRKTKKRLLFLLQYFYKGFYFSKPFFVKYLDSKKLLFSRIPTMYLSKGGALQLTQGSLSFNLFMNTIFINNHVSCVFFNKFIKIVKPLGILLSLRKTSASFSDLCNWLYNLKSYFISFLLDAESPIYSFFFDYLVLLKFFFYRFHVWFFGFSFFNAVLLSSVKYTFLISQKNLLLFLINKMSLLYPILCTDQIFSKKKNFTKLLYVKSLVKRSFLQRRAYSVKIFSVTEKTERVVSFLWLTKLRRNVGIKLFFFPVSFYFSKKISNNSINNLVLRSNSIKKFLNSKVTLSLSFSDFSTFFKFSLFSESSFRRKFEHFIINVNSFKNNLSDWILRGLFFSSSSFLKNLSVELLHQRKSIVRQASSVGFFSFLLFFLKKSRFVSFVAHRKARIPYKFRKMRKRNWFSFLRFFYLKIFPRFSESEGA